MNDNYSLVLGGDANTLDYAEFEETEPVFLLYDNTRLQIKQANPYTLTYLAASIARNPRNLLLHLQRIIYCCQGQYNEEQLYAALVDFFVVLQNAGLSIKRRMLECSRKHLSPVLWDRLQVYCTDHTLIHGNIYTVLTTGLESNMELVIDQTDIGRTADFDPLQIARDYIEYSQLDEAREMLETAILSNPDTVELHEDLLELYKTTNNIEAFNKMKTILSEIYHPMKGQWDALNSYFTESHE